VSDVDFVFTAVSGGAYERLARTLEASGRPFGVDVEVRAFAAGRGMEAKIDAMNDLPDCRRAVYLDADCLIAAAPDWSAVQGMRRDARCWTPDQLYGSRAVFDRFCRRLADYGSVNPPTANWNAGVVCAPCEDFRRFAAVYRDEFEWLMSICPARVRRNAVTEQPAAVLAMMRVWIGEKQGRDAWELPLAYNRGMIRHIGWPEPEDVVILHGAGKGGRDSPAWKRTAARLAAGEPYEKPL